VGNRDAVIEVTILALLHRCCVSLKLMRKHQFRNLHLEEKTAEKGNSFYVTQKVSRRSKMMYPP
jgi:hypothetical protein